MIRLLSLLLPLLVLSCPASADGAAERLAQLRAVMAERLAIMDGVARFKWNQRLPVEDLAREAVVLNETVARAVAEGVDAADATRIVEAQIAAAKIIQAALFEEWRAAGTGMFANAPSLTESLRPEIGRLTGALIAAVREAQNDLGGCDAARTLRPLPALLAGFPEAWSVAVDGVLGEDRDCPL